MAGDEGGYPCDAASGCRLDRQHLFDLRGDRFGGSAAYHGTKGAVRLLTKAAAVQYAPDKIRVNSIHPGVILTPMLDVVPREDLQPMIDLAPMKRGAHPDEVGWAVLFLASDEASFITGSELVVDGGYTAV